MKKIFIQVKRKNKKKCDQRNVTWLERERERERETEIDYLNREKKFVPIINSASESICRL